MASPCFGKDAAERDCSARVPGHRHFVGGNDLDRELGADRADPGISRIVVGGGRPFRRLDLLDLGLLLQTSVKADRHPPAPPSRTGRSEARTHAVQRQ